MIEVTRNHCFAAALASLAFGTPSWAQEDPCASGAAAASAQTGNAAQQFTLNLEMEPEVVAEGQQPTGRAENLAILRRMAYTTVLEICACVWKSTKITEGSAEDVVVDYSIRPTLGSGGRAGKLTFQCAKEG